MSFEEVIQTVDATIVTHIYSDMSGTWCGLEVVRGRTSTGAMVDGSEVEGKAYCPACLEMERKLVEATR